MSLFSFPVQVRWADLDPNFHLRHSVYYDWGAVCRLEFLQDNGLTTSVMQRLLFGPILFREECIFKKEIRMGDKITIDLKAISATKDYGRWSIQHQIFKNIDTLSAILTVDGAWLNVAERKLATPPPEVIRVFDLMPKSEEFKWRER